MKGGDVNEKQINELLYQALETEIGGQKVYESAISCAQNPDLKKEWEEYLEQTRTHEQVLRRAFDALSLDPDTETPGRQVVRFQGAALVKAMEMALQADPAGAQLVAAECVVLAETKDHHNWSLIGTLSEEVKGPRGKALGAAYKEVEDEEDEHLYHTMGWSRELWIESLGMPAVLPPPEEEKSVKTAIGAARAEQVRKDLL
jgi:rubrerythrin